MSSLRRKAIMLSIFVENWNATSRASSQGVVGNRIGNISGITVQSCRVSRVNTHPERVKKAAIDIASSVSHDMLAPRCSRVGMAMYLRRWALSWRIKHFRGRVDVVGGSGGGSPQKGHTVRITR
jgi:hypothetical protein